MLILKKLLKPILAKLRNIALDNQIRKLEAFIEKNKGNKSQSGVTAIMGEKNRQKRKKINLSVKKLVQISKRNPAVILKFIEGKNTPVYQSLLAKQLLAIVQEQVGFIPPKTGIKALFLNLIVPFFSGKKGTIAFNSPEMFVLDPFKTNVYELIKHVHIWHAFRADLPGYDEKILEKFKLLQNSNGVYCGSDLTLSEIADLRNVIERNLDACKFVSDLSTKIEGGKYALEKMQSEKGAAV